MPLFISNRVCTAPIHFALNRQAAFASCYIYLTVHRIGNYHVPSYLKCLYQLLLAFSLFFNAQMQKLISVYGNTSQHRHQKFVCRLGLCVCSARGKRRNIEKRTDIQNKVFHKRENML